MDLPVFAIDRSRKLSPSSRRCSAGIASRIRCELAPKLMLFHSPSASRIVTLGAPNRRAVVSAMLQRDDRHRSACSRWRSEYRRRPSGVPGRGSVLAADSHSRSRARSGAPSPHRVRHGRIRGATPSRRWLFPAHRSQLSRHVLGKRAIPTIHLPGPRAGPSGRPAAVPSDYFIPEALEPAPTVALRHPFCVAKPCVRRLFLCGRPT